MNNGNINIEYPYDANPNQYHLWKPSNGYFPRGEAPPPYEEAVAQNETINAQCTVSVATTHSAPISTGTAMVESSFDVQPNAIATNTTNLININISNSGNITAVASGENHQINKCYSTIVPNAQLRLQPSTQPRSPQYSSLPITANHCTELQQQQQRSPLTANINQIEVFGSDLNAISTIATTSAETNTDALSCNYKNCTISNTLTKPKTKNDVVFQTPQHNRVKKSGEVNLALIQNQPSNTILPPPLFDESTSMTTATLPLLPNDSIRQMKSRRHHRTIPRHFTLNDATNSSSTMNAKTKAKDDANKMRSNCTAMSTLNKKSVCQCPVQHVPMTYMGSAYLNLTRNQQTNEMLLSTLTKKWPSQKSHVAKSASFTSTPSIAATNIVTSTTALGYNRNSASGLLSATNPPKPNGNTDSSEMQTNTSLQSKSMSSKISTISKQIGHNELSTIAHSQVQQQCNDSNDVKSMQELLPISINNNGKVNNNLTLQLNGPKMSQHTESNNMTLAPNTANPVLPPKLSKAQIVNRQAECVSTISKSTTTTNCSSDVPLNGFEMAGNAILNHHRSNFVGREHSKSPAADKTYSMVTPLNVGTDQKINHIKTTYPTTANLTIANNHFSLPKTSAAKSILNIKGQSNALHANNLNYANSSQSTLLNSKLHSSSSKSKKYAVLMHNNDMSLRQELQSNETQQNNPINSLDAYRFRKTDNDKPLPVCTTFTNCSNPKEHFLPNDTSLDDDYLSECENCKSAHGSRYYLNEEHIDQPQETMTLQRKIDEGKGNDEQPYYRTSSTLPTNTKQKTTIIKTREPWFSTIPGSSSSEEDAIE